MQLKRASTTVQKEICTVRITDQGNVLVTLNFRTQYRTRDRDPCFEMSFSMSPSEWEVLVAGVADELAKLGR